MARVIDTNIQTPTSRKKLEPRPTPYFRAVNPDLHLGYRKIEDGPGRWVTRRRIDGKYATENLRAANGAITVADDIAVANGVNVLDYKQALAWACEATSVAAQSTEKLVTVAEALEAYRLDLIKRGGNPDNADRVHLPRVLSQIVVAHLEPKHFKEWNAMLAERELAKASINRLNTSLRAALNLAREQDLRIKNERVWEGALKALPNATRVRKAILTDEQVLALVRAAHSINQDFGLFVEVMALTGARPAQIGRLDVADLETDRSQPRLQMPRSFKGNLEKGGERRPVPISDSLARRLKLYAKGRADNEPLLLMPKPQRTAAVVARWGEHWEQDGRWAKSNHTVRFLEAVRRAGKQVPAGTTIYALRHSSIVRDLLANIPITIVAHKHDTSEKEINTHYARFISDRADDLLRKGMLEVPRLQAVS